MYNTKNILITGANGFVGKHLVAYALAHHYNVYALVRNTNNVAENAAVTYIKADITDYKNLVSTFSNLKSRGIRIHYIIHAAALTKSNSKAQIMNVNYTGTINLYNCLSELDYIPERIAFISSLAACGPVNYEQEISLSTENPVTTYGKSKLQAEKMILSASAFSSVIIRPTAVYGPWDSDLYSVFKLIKNNLTVALGFHRQKLTFIYVMDLVEMIYAALLKGKTNSIYFATDGNVYDKNDLSTFIASALQKKPANLKLPLGVVKMVAFLSQQVSNITGKANSLNMEKFHEITAESWNCAVWPSFYELEYTPKYSLKRGIKETAEWYKNNNWI